MAHVKVIRRSMLPDEWTDIRIRWLRRMLIAKKHEITGWTIREGRQTGDDTYDMYDETPRPLQRGDEYFTPDGTAFMRVSAVLPEDFWGFSEVRLLLPTAAEMLVRVNGVLQGGIDPNRETMVLPKAEDGRYEIEIEGYNRSKPDDDRNEETTVYKGCRQVFQGAYFAVLNEDAAALYHDVFVFRNIVRGGQFDEHYALMVSDRLYHALSLVDWDTGDGLCEAKRYIDKELYESSLYRGVGKVALVAHSHLDIAYYWRRKHAVQKNARTCLIQLELMDRYPFLRYTHTQAYLFETLEQYYPDLFARVREKAQSGQFEPAGGMYVESDCNIPWAESLARQFLYGQRYFKEKFGKICNNCWLPDVFGTSAVLPQILKKSGIRYYVSNKMSTWNDTNRFPHNSFIWRGLDGSEVYACVPPTHFITAATPTEVMQNWAAYQDKDSGAATLCMYGYGDGGSGVTEEMLKTIECLQKISAMPEIQITGGADYLTENLNERKKLAVWDGELYLEMHRGTFTTKSELKRRNRMLEMLLRDTELLCALRWLRGADYPADELRDAWKTLLINQFHDIIPGSHIRPVYEDAMADYDKIETVCHTLLNADAETYLNTLSFDRKAPVFLPDETSGDIRLGVRGRFARGEMKALSAARFFFPKACADWVNVVKESGGILQVRTDALSVTLLPDGSFRSVTDEHGREYVKGEFNKVKLFRDVPGNYDAWDILPTYREVELAYAVSDCVHPVRMDGETAVFECTLETAKSRITRTIRFFRGERFVETEYDIAWHENHVLMKAEFQCNVRAPYTLCDLGAGYMARENNRNTTWQQARYEVCHHKWADMSETGGGVALINMSKYGIGIWDNTLSLSLLRATCRPDLISDRGDHRFSHLTYFHDGTAQEAGVNRLAYEYNIPIRAVSMPSISWQDMGSLFLQAMKLSEDGKKLVLRLTEQDGRRGSIRFPFSVTLMNLLEDEDTDADTISFAPFEMLTIALGREDAAKWLFGGA